MRTEEIENRITEINYNIKMLEDLKCSQEKELEQIDHRINFLKARINRQEIQLEKYDEMRKQNEDL